MRVDDLMLFALVVRLRSFRAAAKQRGVTNSVVSKHISRLESDMNTQLLHRSTRKLSLTEAGKLLYSHCQSLEQHVEQACEALNAYNAEPVGVLRITSPVISGQLFLPKVIQRYLGLYPLVEVDMVIQDRFDDLIEQGFDLAIRTGTLADSSLVGKRLVTSCWQAFASPAYVERHGMPQSVDELANHECLLFSPEQSEKADWPCLSSVGETTVSVNGRFRANSLMALSEAVLDGMGVAFLPYYLVHKECAAGRLLPVLESHLFQRVGIYVLYPQGRYLPAKTRAFITLLSEMFAAEEELFRGT